jgi:hypothetical protein
MTDLFELSLGRFVGFSASSTIQEWVKGQAPITHVKNTHHSFLIQLSHK